MLDVVTWVQRHADATLCYRFACRVGMCGSCAMMVNGSPRWTCRSHVSAVSKDGRLEIAPLANMPVIKDLVVDMSGFFDKWRKAEGRFQGERRREDEVSEIVPNTHARIAVDEAIECINCGVCYSACDTVKWNPEYLGPASLNRVWTLLNDERDTADTKRLAAVAKAGGCFNCHSHQSCQAFCPKALNPTRSIAGVKRVALRGRT